MGNIIGSCLGSFSATCAINCLSINERSPSWITNSADSFLTLFPIFWMFILSQLNTQLFRESTFPCLVIGTIVSNALMFVSGESRKYYGLRFFVPLIFGFVGFYRQFDSSFLESCLSPSLPLVSFSIVSAICLSDIGLGFNEMVRQSFDYLYATYWLLIVYQIFLAVISVAILCLSVTTIGDWRYTVAVFFITILVIWDFGTLRGSIMSVAILVGGLVAIQTNMTINALFIVVLTIYNNFVLHSEKIDRADTPLLDDVRDEENFNSRSRFLINTLLSVSQFLICSENLSMSETSDVFFITGFAVYVWIILAPIVLPSRVF